MNRRAEELIERLRLLPHPEGGHYREIFRAGKKVTVADRGFDRPALTTIYFLLGAGDRSRWHRILADEIWHHYEGDPLQIFWIEGRSGKLNKSALGPLSGESEPVAVVPGGCWMAARCDGNYSLIGCSSGPGFEFEDFELAADNPAEAEYIAGNFPELAAFL